ncbi:alpha-amylase family glycosyl hydrolase [Ruminococcus sp.]|uniref:alpha-amylase family glycosyl hydrolase n=1 Tax=Ruminococcus sp. TaxID=41978 RepID=UPI003868FBF7
MSTSWLKNSVFYEIYPQSFCDSNSDGIGDLRGIVTKLDYIKNLGCNAIWINPIYDSPFMDAGYDVRDYKKIAPRYGTMEDFEHLLEQAHKRDMKILLDLVPGHTSDTHEWFQSAKTGFPTPHDDRYIFTKCVWDAPTEYRMMCGVCERDGNYLVNYFSSQPALNYGFYEVTHPEWQFSSDSKEAWETVDALKDIMRFWLNKGIDGFRVDMADSLVKNDDDKVATAKIWRNIREMMDADYPDAVLVSEWSNPLRAIVNAGFHADFYLDHQGNGYNELFRKRATPDSDNLSVFADGAHGDITAFLADYVPAYLCSKDHGYISFITNNHDMPRAPFYMSEWMIQLSHAFIMTMPGVPFVYYGDEIGMRYRTDLISKEGGFSRTGSRTPMQWNHEKNLGFSDADEDMLYLPLDYSEGYPTVEDQMGVGGSIYENLKSLISLRKANPELMNESDFEIVYAREKEYPFVYKRGSFTAFINPSDEDKTIDFDADGMKEYYFLGGYEIGEDSVTIRSRSFLLLRNEG